MKRSSCSKLVLSLLALSVTAELGTWTLRAQSVSSPAVALRRFTLSQNVWPGDFNGDGITDLAGSEEPSYRGGTGRVIVLTGNGGGLFSAPSVTGYEGRVLGVGDFNGDGRIDLIVAAAAGAGVAILPGNGDATFADPRPVAATSDVTFAISSDLDGDGKRDLIVGAEGFTVAVLPGRGDFTFGPEITLAANASPHDGIIADLDGDGKKDVIVANHLSHGVTVFLNQGGLRFTGTDVAVGGNANDVTVSDVNRDGHLDLIVATSSGGDGDNFFEEGHAEVLPGRGDGTFSPGTAYEVPRGAWAIVAGDFTRDGIIDIATANRSSIFSSRGCGSDWQTWDSVTILPGRADGSFGAPSSFSLGNQGDVDDADFKNQVLTLNTSDLNRDGATDLIASWGVILLNAEGHSNLAPTVDAGPDQQLGDVRETVLQARASDGDEDMLSWRWTDASGAVIARWPNVCRSGLNDGVHVFTVTVDDGHGHQVSDSITVTVGGGSTSPGPGITLPISALTDGDLGVVGHAGSSNISNGVITVTGSGADIWGTADAFHFVYGRTDAIDSTAWEVTTHVDSIQNVNPWTKAGVMVRAGFTSTSPHASLIVSPGKGIAFQRRLTTGGASLSTSGPALTAPVWLRLTLQRAASQEIVRAYYRKNATDPWTLIGRDTFPDVMPKPLLGLAVTSHLTGVPATAAFSDVLAGSLATGWTAATVGSTSGSASTDGTVFDVTGGGADIWGAADQFSYLYQAWTGDGAIVARVRSLQNANAWSKAGVMFRETIAANAKQVDMIVSPSKGIAMQFRAVPGGATAGAGSGPGAAPGWLRLSRAGNVFTAAWSSDGAAWTTVGATTVAMPPAILVGLAVTSHNTSATAAASFDDVVLQQP